MIGSLFPQRATKKGATPSQFGPYFGSAALSVFFLAPFTGKIINNVGLGSAFKYNFSLSVESIGFCFLALGVALYETIIYF